MEIILPENHTLFTSANHINQICAPLFKTFEITTFSYVKINPDYSRIHLENHPEWSNFFYQRLHDYHKATKVTECQHWHSGYAPLHTLAEKDCIQDAQAFNIGDGLVIADHYENQTELVYFALPTNASNKLTNLLNNIDLLKKFITYFKHQAHDIIKNAEKNPIILPFLKEDKIQEINYFSMSEAQKHEFLTSINHHLLNQNKLSKRELECLQYIKKGYTAKMIANELRISNRTAEHHLAHIRTKLKINSIKKLLKIYND